MNGEGDELVAKLNCLAYVEESTASISAFFAYTNVDEDPSTVIPSNYDPTTMKLILIRVNGVSVAPMVVESKAFSINWNCVLSVESMAELTSIYLDATAAASKEKSKKATLRTIFTCCNIEHLT